MDRHYYNEEVPSDVLSFLADATTDDPLITPQDSYPLDVEIQKQALNNACLAGKVVIFVTDRMMILVTRKNAVVGNFDTKVGKDTTARDVVRGYKAFVKWAKENTFYYKLETRTPLEKFARSMAKATPDAAMEGVREKSYMTKEGNLVNEYLVGIKLRETESCQS